MHAKRTRVRKKVQMEEIQETINKVRSSPNNKKQATSNQSAV